MKISSFQSCMRLASIEFISSSAAIAAVFAIVLGAGTNVGTNVGVVSVAAQNTDNIDGPHTVYSGDHYADCTSLFCFGNDWGSNGQFAWYVKVTFSQSAASYCCSSCFSNTVEYYDWNKLWGKARCGYTHNHQQDSDRFVWRRLQNLHSPANCGGLANCTGIQLGTYSYDAGVTPYPNENWRLSHTFSTILQPGVSYVLGMESFDDGNVVHSLFSSEWELLESKTNTHTNLCSNFEQGAVQGLYFGGTCEAPEDVTVVYEAVDGPPGPIPSPTNEPSMVPSASLEPSSPPSGSGVCSNGSPDPFPGERCSVDDDCGCSGRRLGQMLMIRNDPLKERTLQTNCLDVTESGCTHRSGKSNSCCSPYECVNNGGTKTCTAAATSGPTNSPTNIPSEPPSLSASPSHKPTDTPPAPCGCVFQEATNPPTAAPTPGPTPTVTTNCINPNTCVGNECQCTSNSPLQCCSGYSCKLNGNGPNVNTCV